MIGKSMVQSRLKVIIAERNLERAKRHIPELTIRRIAEEAGLSPSVITALTTNRAQGVQFETLNRLCGVLGCTPGDILEYTPDTMRT